MFIEAQFPANISIAAIGGPTFSTDIVAVTSGYEKRNINWSRAKAKYEVSHAVKTESQYADLLAFFNMVRGRAGGFRFKDHLDYTTTINNGILYNSLNNINPTTLVANEAGYSNYTLAKMYKYGSVVSDYYVRELKKPVNNTAIVYRNGTPVPIGSSPGNIESLSYTTGEVIFKPQYTFTCTAVTKGTTTTITLTGDQRTTIAVGNILKFGNCASNGITSLTNSYHAVNSVSSTTPFTTTTVVLSTNTSTYTGTWTGSTSVYKYMQGNLFTMSCEFDVPCRFDTDSMEVTLDNHLSRSWTNIPLVEIKI